MENVKLRKNKPKLTQAQAAAWAKLDGQYRSSFTIGANEASLWALVTKGLAQSKMLDFTNCFCKKDL